MLIKDMFKKPIDRDIKGVIVVGEGEDSNAKQELEEYVVTRELSKHFREFFDNYKKGIVGETTKTGVWISGFFGSGKSHFLKILSYLLDGQKLIGGKRAVDYFIDDHKIEDTPIIFDDAYMQDVESIANSNVELCRKDWDSFETSWDFKHHPLV